MSVIYNPSDMTYMVDGEKISKKDYEDPTAWWPSTTVGTGTITTGAFPSSSSILSTLGVSQRDKIIRGLVDDGYWVKMTGSRVTKDGWTSESDWDYVVYDPDQKLKDTYNDWVAGSEAEQGEFLSVKKDNINLILVDKEEIWKKYIIATNLIKTLNSKTKGERIAVFDSVFGTDKNATAVDFGVSF